jgi:hypothetical protein
LVAARGEWTVREGESFFAIVRKLYPDQPARKKALVALMRQLNPELPRDGEKHLPAGMHLKMPTRLDRLPGTGNTAPQKLPTAPSPLAAAALAPAAASKGTSTPSSPALPSKTANAAMDRLVVSGAKTTSIQSDPAIQQMEQKEAALSDQLSDELAKLNEANYRVEKLEKRMNFLLAELARRDQEAKAQKAADELKAQAEKRRNWLEIAIGSLAGGALVAAIAFVLHRISRKRDTLAQPNLLSGALVDDKESMLWQDLNTLPPTTEHPGEPVERPQARPSASDMDVYFLNNVASEAALLAAHGQYEQGVGLLLTEIERHPTQLVNWMQLLELLHGHRDVAQFIEYATKFKERFASEALWEKVARMGRELSPTHALFKRQRPASASTPAATPPNVDVSAELKRVLDGLSDGTEAKSPDAADGADLRLDFISPQEDMLATMRVKPLSPDAPRPTTAKVSAPVVPPKAELAALDDNMLDLILDPVETHAPDTIEAPIELPALKGQQPHWSDEAPIAPAPDNKVLQAIATAEKEMMFELDLDEIPTSPAQEIIVEEAHVPAIANGDLDMTGVTEGSLEHAKRLINAGRREEGATLLEHVMLVGNLNERLAAAEMLVNLTSPS